MELDEDQYKKFIKAKKIDQFLANLKHLLSPEEFKQFLFKHLLDILHQIKQVNELNQLWEVIEKTLTPEEIVELLITRFTCKQWTVIKEKQHSFTLKTFELTEDNFNETKSK